MNSALRIERREGVPPVYFKRVSAQAMEMVRTQDTGTLQYDIYFNNDQSECIVLERLPNSGRASSRRSLKRSNSSAPA